jgi:N-acetylmuramic acid 6-phosphate etherase
VKKIHFGRLATEQENPRTNRLDTLSPQAFVSLVNREDQQVLRAVKGASAEIARAIQVIAGAFRQGGRLFFIGAGTSGRLGIIEAAECPPTFGTPASLVQAIMAGGHAAVFRSKEGAEDSEEDGDRQIRRRVRAKDVVVGIAASGVTPFVRAGLAAAKSLGASTILVTCHADPSQKKVAQVVVGLKTGPEILTGSTRLKAGSACKMVLNLLTTGSMVQVGKVYGHWMVDLQPKSLKLVARGQRLIQRLAGVSEKEAERLFAAADRRVKVAIVMAKRRVDVRTAEALLKNADGFLRKVL